MKNSQNKGKNFERLIAKKLTETLGIEFKRTPQSGASPLGQDWQLLGDIVTKDSNWEYCIELKKQEGWEFKDFFNKKSKIYKWWEQAEEQATKISKIPVLIFSKNYDDIYVMMKIKDFENIKNFFIMINNEFVILKLNDWLSLLSK
jgi:Holliday junction resolvase